MSMLSRKDRYISGYDAVDRLAASQADHAIPWVDPSPRLVAAVDEFCDLFDLGEVVESAPAPASAFASIDVRTRFTDLGPEVALFVFTDKGWFLEASTTQRASRCLVADGVDVVDPVSAQIEASAQVAWSPWDVRVASPVVVAHRGPITSLMSTDELFACSFAGSEPFVGVSRELIAAVNEFYAP